MTAYEIDAIRWEVAKRLEGMREECPRVTQWRDGTIATSHAHAEVACPGYYPVPLTAEGLLDEGRLRRAIEAAGWELSYLRQVSGAMKWYLWRNRERKGGDPDLAVAYLKAIGAWPLKEDAHD